MLYIKDMKVIIKGLAEEFDLRDFPNVPRAGDLLNLAAMIINDPRLKSLLAGKMYKVRSVSWLKENSEYYMEVYVDREQENLIG